jgi:hypothetical protein
MSILGDTFITHTGIQPGDQATCADTSLIMLQGIVEGAGSSLHHRSISIFTPQGTSFIPMDVYGEKLVAQLRHYATTGEVFESAQRALDEGYTVKIGDGYDHIPGQAGTLYTSHTSLPLPPGIEWNVLPDPDNHLNPFDGNHVAFFSVFSPHDYSTSFLPVSVYDEKLVAQFQYYARTGIAFEGVQKALDSGHTVLPVQNNDHALVLYQTGEPLSLQETIFHHGLPPYNLDPKLAAQTDYYAQTGIAFETLQHHMYGHVATPVDDQIQNYNVVQHALPKIVGGFVNLLSGLSAFVASLTTGALHHAVDSSGNGDVFAHGSFGGHPGDHFNQDIFDPASLNNNGYPGGDGHPANIHGLDGHDTTDMSHLTYMLLQDSDGEHITTPFFPDHHHAA